MVDPIYMNGGEIYTKLRFCMCDYLKKNKNIKSFVLGLSGGIDSTLSAVFLNDFLKEYDIALIGISMPSNTNTAEETKRAELIGQAFCDMSMEIDIMPFVEPFLSFSEDTFPNETIEKIRKGNFKARTRMMFLYDIAKATKGVVVSTANLTEEMTGFWTLHGDVGDLEIFSSLWKTEVYNLANMFFEKFKKENKDNEAELLKQSIDALPADGLGISNSDFDQLGVSSYEEADNALIEYADSTTVLNEKIIKRYLDTDFKRNLPYRFSL